MTVYTETVSGDRTAHEALADAEMRAFADNPGMDVHCANVSYAPGYIDEAGHLIYTLTADFVPVPKPTEP